MKFALLPHPPQRGTAPAWFSFFLCGSLVISFLPLPSRGGEIVTKPKGIIVTEVPAGTGTQRSLALLSLPLSTYPSSVAGLPKGIFGSLAGRIARVPGAGWTPGALSPAEAPLALLVTTGAAEGRVFRIVSNTETDLELDTVGRDLDSFGILAGADKFELIELDTLFSLLGSPATTGVQGGTTPGSADLVQMTDDKGKWKSYYYKTDSQPPGWVLSADGSPADNVIVRPESAFFYARMATTPLDILISGEISHVFKSRIDLPSTASYLIGSLWPVRSSLDELGLNTLPDWISNTDPTKADQVQVLTDGRFWQAFFHDGTSWRKVYPNRVSADKVVQAGRGILIRRFAPGPRMNTFLSSAPYPLQ